MQFIENVSMAAIIKGDHYLDENNTILIQIQDKGTWEFATPKYKDKFVEIHQFEFDDLEEGSTAITHTQANEIANILQSAYNEGRSVVVHCAMGLCRSGAVAEVGVMLGFSDVENLRIPNVLVKKMILNYICWFGEGEYDEANT